MSGLMAAAQALHLDMPSMPVGISAAAGLESGTLGLSLADIKLLADSDSESEAEGELLGPGAAPPAQAPVPLQRPKSQLDPGPVHKYGWEALQRLDSETLCKEVWAVDRPAVFCPSFRRLKKKTRVPPVKKLGRALKQIAETGKLTGGIEQAKDLYKTVACGEETGPGFRHLSRKQASRAVHTAVRTSLRRLCHASSRAPAVQVNEQMNRVKDGMKSADGYSTCGLLLAAAQSQMYRSTGRKVERLPAPGGQEFRVGGQEEVPMLGAGFLSTLWLRLHEEPEVQAAIAGCAQDEALGQAIAACGVVVRFFEEYVHRMRCLAQRRGWGAVAVKLEVALLASERGRLHLHIYIGRSPRGSGIFGDDSYEPVAFLPSELQVDTIKPHVVPLRTRNGKGVGKYLQGGLYYCTAAKLGSVLTFSTHQLWKDRRPLNSRAPTAWALMISLQSSLCPGQCLQGAGRVGGGCLGWRSFAFAGVWPGGRRPWSRSRFPDRSARRQGRFAVVW